MNASTAWVRILLLAAMTLPAGGCYVMQAARGQWQVMSQRQPIASVIADPQTPPTVKTRLEQVLQIRQFAVSELGLPDNGSYRSYADLKRPYVVWNVFAAPEFSVTPKRWCFPVAGCVTYRGYFSEKKARKFADKLKVQGLDVFVGGVPAYSTLGHFEDPVLNTMIGWDDVQLAAIVFHELTHQLIYVPGDPQFNEALATVVEEEGVRRWLLQAGREKDLAGYQDLRARYAKAVRRSIDARERLRTVYTSGAAPEAMRQEKQTVLKEANVLNNAHLASVATYEEYVPGLKALLAGGGDDLQVFYGEARGLARLTADERRRRLYH